MTSKTRYFVIVSSLVLTLGVGAGLVAYYVDLPTTAFSAFQDGPDELRYVPRDAAVVAYADVQQVMASELRERLREAIPSPDGQNQFRDQTGINIETDIDRIVAFLDTKQDVTGGPGAGLVLARGRFDAVRIESLMREHGAEVEDYKGVRMIVVDVSRRGDTADPAQPVDPPPAAPERRQPATFGLAFLEPGLVAVGHAPLLRTAVDLQSAGESVTANGELMELIRSIENGNSAWAVGRFDALTARARLPERMSTQLPAITWFSASGEINGGVRGVLRADTRDEQAATDLRDVVRGFLALGNLQMSSRPELQAMMRSLQLGGTGKTVALSFEVPADALNLIGKSRQ
jgi:hypothetical protein